MVYLLTYLLCLRPITVAVFPQCQYCILAGLALGVKVRVTVTDNGTGGNNGA